MKIEWNYDDVEQDIVSVYLKKHCIGYFKLTDDNFRIITDGMNTPEISMIVLSQIVSEYPDAIKTAGKYMLSAENDFVEEGTIQ